MAKKKEPPKFAPEKAGQGVSPELAKLGVEMSKELPTFDVPIELIEPNDWNPNEMEDETFNRLVEEMDETGIITPIQIVPSEGGKFRIIGGEHRWAGAKSLGLTSIPANILTDDKFVDEDLQKLLTVRLNVIQGKMNPDKFITMYQDVAERYGTEQLQALFGFTETDAWNKLTKGLQKAVKETGIGGSGLLAELEKKTKKIRTVDGLGSVLKNIFKKYGSDLTNSFMVFTYGGKQHLYITASEETMASMVKITEHCRETDKDVNDVISSFLKEAADTISK